MKNRKRVRQGTYIPPWEDASFWKNPKEGVSTLKRLPVLSKALLSSGDISQHILYSENLRKQRCNDRLLRTGEWQF